MGSAAGIQRTLMYLEVLTPPSRVLICRRGCKQLIRSRARRRLTGRDSRGAAERWEGVTSPSLSLRSLLLPLRFHPLLSHQRLPGRRGAIIVSHLHPHVSLTCGSEPRFNPPRCTSALLSRHSFIPLSCLCLPRARRAASSRAPDLLINNGAALAQRILLLSVFSTLKLMSDGASIFTGLHHSGDVTPSCTPPFPLHLRQLFGAFAARFLARFSLLRAR